MNATSNSKLPDNFRPAGQIILFLLWAAASVTYFFGKVPIIWSAGWSHDDLMNTYRALEVPYLELLRQTVCFWQPTPLFRPLGELFYKVFFDTAGWEILPWRMAVIALSLLNALLLAHVARRLTGSFSAGLLAMALATFHPHWTHLYLNTGTIFEVLAFTFVWGGMALYLEARHHACHEKPWLLALLAVIYILGLNAKESAITLPAFLCVFELCVHRRIPWRAATLLGVISLAFIFGRVLGPEGLSSVGSYQPIYNSTIYLARFRTYFGHLLLWPAMPLPAAIGLALLPLLCRTRPALFAATVFPIGILPLAFVPDRGVDGVYIACAALPLAAAAFIALLPHPALRLAAAHAAFLALFLYAPPINFRAGWDKENLEIWNFQSSLQALLPTAPKDAQIRILDEPFSAEYPWASTFLARLAYRDPSIVVVSPNNPHTKDFPATKDFAVFAWRGGKNSPPMLVRLK